MAAKLKTTAILISKMYAIQVQYPDAKVADLPQLLAKIPLTKNAAFNDANINDARAAQGFVKLAADADPTALSQTCENIASAINSYTRDKFESFGKSHLQQNNALSTQIDQQNENHRKLVTAYEAVKKAQAAIRAAYKNNPGAASKMLAELSSVTASFIKKVDSGIRDHNILATDLRDLQNVVTRYVPNQDTREQPSTPRLG